MFSSWKVEIKNKLKKEDSSTHVCTSYKMKNTLRISQWSWQAFYQQAFNQFLLLLLRMDKYKVEKIKTKQSGQATCLVIDLLGFCCHSKTGVDKLEISSPGPRAFSQCWSNQKPSTFRTQGRDIGFLLINSCFLKKELYMIYLIHWMKPHSLS